MTATQYLSNVADCLRVVEATGPRGDVLTIDEAMTRCVERLKVMKQMGGEVHLVGNGGSASVVAHAHNDFVKAARMRARVCQDLALLTAISNDLDYSESAALPLSIYLRPSDVVFVVSSSGESPNVLSAVDVARQRKAVVMTCSGFHATNRLRQMGDLNFYVPSLNYGHVELTHAVLLHHITDEVARVG